MQTIVSQSNRNSNNEYVIKFDGEYIITLDDEQIPALKLEQSVSNVSLNLSICSKLHDRFLTYSKLVTINLSLPNVTEIGDGFLRGNELMSNVTLHMPLVVTIGNDFLHIPHMNTPLTLKIVAPLLETVGNDWLSETYLSDVKLEFERLTSVGSGWLFCARFHPLRRFTTILINCPSLVSVGDYWLANNVDHIGHFKTIIATPELRTIGSHAFMKLQVFGLNLHLPKLEKTGIQFLSDVRAIDTVVLTALLLKDVFITDFYIRAHGVFILLPSLTRVKSLVVTPCYLMESESPTWANHIGNMCPFNIMSDVFMFNDKFLNPYEWRISS